MIKFDKYIVRFYHFKELFIELNKIIIIKYRIKIFSLIFREIN